MQVLASMQDAVAALSSQLAEREAPEKPERKVIRIVRGADGRLAGAEITETEG